LPHKERQEGRQPFVFIFFLFFLVTPGKMKIL